MQSLKASSLRNILLSSIFLFMVFTPLVFFFFSLEKDVSRVENRALAEAPSAPVSARDLQAFPKKFDAYFSDHFGFRDAIIRGYNILKFKIGDSPTADIMIGQEGWLYLGSPKPSNKYKDVFDSALNITTFEDDELESIASNFQQKKDWLKDQGIEYVFVLVPEKHTVYPEYLPKFARRPQGKTSTEQLRDYLQKHTDVPVVDVLPEILNRKKDTQVYYKKDTHWNHEGSSVAYTAIINAVNAQLLASGQHPIELSFMLSKRDAFRGDISNFIGVDVYDVFNPAPVFETSCAPQGQAIPASISPKDIVKCEGKEKKLLLFGDSFSDSLMAYFSHAFGTTTYVRDRPLFEGMKRYIDVNKPDVVIEQWAERKTIGLTLESSFATTETANLFTTGTAPIVEIEYENFNPNGDLQLKEQSEIDVTYSAKKGSAYVQLTGLNFTPGKAYVLEIDAVFSSQSTIQVFFSNSAQESGYPYSNVRWLRQKTYPGERKLYFHLNFENLGSSLRIHPTLNPEDVTIKSIKLREVEGDLVAVSELSPASP